MSGGHLAARDPIRGSLKRFAAFKHAINTTKADVSTDFGDTSAFSKNATVCEVYGLHKLQIFNPIRRQLYPAVDVACFAG